MSSVEILRNRVYHYPVFVTEPVEAGFGIKGTVSYTRWDDGIVTSKYVYQRGGETVLRVSHPEFFEIEFKPKWIAVCNP